MSITSELAFTWEAPHCLWTLYPEYTLLLSTTANNQVQIISILHPSSYSDLLIDLPLPFSILSTHGGCMLLNAALIMPLSYLNTFHGGGWSG